MYSKPAFLLKGKLAVALLGALLLAGGGATAVVAATGAQVQLPLVSQAQGHPGNDANDDRGNNQGASHNDGQQAEGTIKSIDSGSSSFVLAPEHGSAVTVVVTAQTVFEGGVSSLGSLKVGQHVEAKGTVQTDGTLLATKIEGQDQDANGENDQNENEAAGLVASVNADNSSFVLKLSSGATQTVTVSAQTVFDGGLNKLSDLKAGLFVEVKGNLQANGTLAATRVHREDDANDDHGGANEPGDDHGGNSGSDGSGSGGNSGSGHN